MSNWSPKILWPTDYSSMTSITHIDVINYSSPIILRTKDTFSFVCDSFISVRRIFPCIWSSCYRLVCHFFCPHHILTSSVIYYWTDKRQYEIYLLNIFQFSKPHVLRKIWRIVKTYNSLSVSQSSQFSSSYALEKMVASRNRQQSF